MAQCGFGKAAADIASSVTVADLSPLENPNITFARAPAMGGRPLGPCFAPSEVVLLSMFSMSIALVVWGRNGF